MILRLSYSENYVSLPNFIRIALVLQKIGLLQKYFGRFFWTHNNQQENN